MKKIYKDILNVLGYDDLDLANILNGNELLTSYNEWIFCLEKNEEWSIRKLATELYGLWRCDNTFESWDFFKSLMKRLLKTVAKFNPNLSWSIQCHEFNDSDKLLNK